LTRDRSDFAQPFLSKFCSKPDMTMAGSTTRPSFDEQSSHGLLNTGNEKRLVGGGGSLSSSSLLLNFASFALGGSVVAVIMSLSHSAGAGTVGSLETTIASSPSLNGNIPPNDAHARD
jgi:hypothetical protein